MNPAVSEIQALAPAADLQAQGPAAPAAPAAGFGEWFSHELSEVNTKLVQAEQGVQQLAAGEATNLHEVMIRLEEARLSFQLAIQFRTKVLEAYQDVMRMQV
jgi:flagellar hook-basal body complex protein FliE